MGIIDYGNLKGRADAGRKEEESKGKGLPEGEYPCIFREGELTKSQAGNEMFKLEWRCKMADRDDPKHGIIIKQFKTITGKTGHQLTQFLTLMEDLGVDLRQVTGPEKWSDVFEDLEEGRVSVLIKVKYKEGDKDENGEPKAGAYPEKDVIEILKGLPGAAQEEEAKPEPKPEPAPKKEKAKPAKVEEPVEEAKPEPAADNGDDW